MQYPIRFCITLCPLCQRFISVPPLLRHRYVALCFPFYRLKHYLRARFFIVPILILAPLYNVPRFFEYEIRSRVTKFCANYSGRGVPYEFTEFEYDNLTAGDIASCADDWEDRKTAALVVTDFRNSVTYIQVGFDRVPSSVKDYLGCKVATVKIGIRYSAHRCSNPS